MQHSLSAAEVLLEDVPIEENVKLRLCGKRRGLVLINSLTTKKFLVPKFALRIQIKTLLAG